ncbi:MAG: dTMP kinase, partial [Crocosphaera sp.]
FSSLAYNSNNQEEFNFVYGLNQRFPNPDLVIYLEIPLNVALSRLDNALYKEVYETKEKLQKVKSNYQKIFQSYTGKILTIDATNNIEEINREIRAYLEKNFS